MSVNENISRKEEILQVATNMFMESGYSNTSMRDLARRLDIKAPSLYSHIQGKAELLRILCFRMADEFLAGLAEATSAEGSAKDQMEVLIRNHIQLVIKDPAASMVFFNEWRHLELTFLHTFLDHRDNYTHGFEALIRKGSKEGMFYTDNPAFAAQLILSTLNGMPRWVKNKKAQNKKEIEDQTTIFILNGLSNQ